MTTIKETIIIASVAVANHLKTVNELNNIIVSMIENDNDNNNVAEEQIIRVRNTRNTPTRNTFYVENAVLRYNDLEFRQHFRLTRDAFEFLFKKISAELTNEKFGRPMADLKPLLMAVIWLLATPDSYRSVGDRFNIAKSSLSDGFIRVINIVCDLSINIIKWPSAERRVVIATHLRRCAGIKNVIGAIDGTYVPIKAPKDNPEVYINRKCFYGITLQGICDHELRYTDCFVGYPSSVSDRRIFDNSDIFAAVSSNMAQFITPEEIVLGDKAYPVLPWLIPPYINRGRLTRSHINFNTAHAKTRQIIERSWALLFGRFRRLRYLDMKRTDMLAPTILVCCTLHNICLDFKEDVSEFVLEGINLVTGEANESSDQSYRIDPNLSGVPLRERMREHLSNGQTLAE